MATEQTTLEPTERERDLGREAYVALARATWFTEYLEREFALVRAEERERCQKILAAHFFGDPRYRKAEEAIRAGQ